MFVLRSTDPPGCQCACQTLILPLRHPRLRQQFTGCTYLSCRGHIQAGGAGIRRCDCHFANIELYIISKYVSKFYVFPSFAADLDLEENLQSTEGQSHMWVCTIINNAASSSQATHTFEISGVLWWNIYFLCSCSSPSGCCLGVLMGLTGIERENGSSCSHRRRVLTARCSVQ